MEAEYTQYLHNFPLSSMRQQPDFHPSIPPQYEHQDKKTYKASLILNPKFQYQTFQTKKD